MSTVLLVSNTSWYLYNFRLPLIRDLREKDIEWLLSRLTMNTVLLEDEGFTVHPWLVARSSVNPLAEAHALIDLLRIYRREQPDLVHHFTIKACLYGTIAAMGARYIALTRSRASVTSFLLHASAAAASQDDKPLYRATFKARRSPSFFRTLMTREVDSVGDD